MFITRQRKPRPGGGYYFGWVLRGSYWDKELKRTRQIHLSYIGKTRTITESRAREIAEKVSKKLGRPVTVEDLRRVRRLRIVPDEALKAHRREG